MHPDVRKLLQVQKVDQSLARLTRELDSIPKERAERQARLDKLQGDLDAARQAKEETDLRIRELDLAIRQSDNDIKTLEGKLGAIKNNAEYQAILFQIEAVKKDRDSSEEESLALMEKSGPQEGTITQAQEGLAAEQKVFDEFEAEAQKLIDAQQGEIDKVKAQREPLLEGVPIELVEEYERLFEVRNNEAICAAEDQYCQGCYTQFTVNDLAKLQGGKAVIRCTNCQRILYLPE